MDDLLYNNKDKLNLKNGQNYFLLGICIAGTLLLLIAIKRISTYYYKPIINPDMLYSYVSPEIEVPLYLISWVFGIFFSFSTYYLLDKYLSKKRDKKIKHLLSKYFFLLSLIALLFFFVTEGLTATNLGIVLVCYLTMVCLFLFSRPIFLQNLNNVINWGIVVIIGLADLLLIYSIATESGVFYNILVYVLKDMMLLREIYYSTSEFLFFIFAATAFVVILIFSQRKTIQKTRKITILIDFFVVLAISYAIFNIQYGYFDSSYLIGPINDILHGKNILINSTSQYGLLSVYIIAFLFKAGSIPLTYGNFALLNTLSYIMGYTLIYVALRGWLKNILIAIFGLFLIVQQNYFIQIANPLFFPQVGFLRFGWWIPVMLLLLIRTKLNPERVYLQNAIRVSELLIVATAFFWSFDTGVYVLGAYMVAVIAEIFYNKLELRIKLKQLFLRLIEVVTALFLLFALISIFIYARAHQWPDWYQFVQYSLLYSISGMGMIPIPKIGLYILFLFVYILSSSYIILKLFFDSDKMEKDISIISFITAYGIMQFIYYVGRSHTNNLHHVVIPFIILICWFMLKGVNFVLSIDGRIFLRKNILIVSVVSIFVVLLISVPIITSTKQMLSDIDQRESIINLIEKRDDINRLISLDEQTQFRKSITAVEVNEEDAHQVAIISVKDTYFLVKSNRINTMNSNNLHVFILRSQLENLGLDLLRIKPKNIYIDSKITALEDGESVKILKNMILNNYSFAENVGVLDRYVLMRDSQ